MEDDDVADLVTPADLHPEAEVHFYAPLLLPSPCPSF